MSRIGEMVPQRIKELVPKEWTTRLAVGAAAVAMYIGGSSAVGAAEAVFTPNDSGSTPENTNSTLDAPATADENCATPAYNPSEYQSAVGPNLIGTIGETTASGVVEFDSTDENVVANEVGTKFAPNNAALATAYTIISAESGISDDQALAQKSTELYSQMQANPATRDQICNAVEGRIRSTPQLGEFQSPTGKIAIMTPEYDASGNLVGVKSVKANNFKPIYGFNLAPVAGSDDEALQEAIANTYVYTPDGQIVVIAHKEGNSKGKKNAKQKGGGKGIVGHQGGGGKSSGTFGNSNANGEGDHIGPVKETGAGSNHGNGGPTGHQPGNAPSFGGGGSSNGSGNSGGGNNGGGTPPSSPPSSPPPHEQLPPKDPPQPLPPTPQGY